MKPEFFVNNRKKLRELSKSHMLVITGNGLMQRNSDVTFPYRQDSNFWYLTGINEPDLILVMDKTKEYIIAPTRSHSRTVFDGGLDVEEITKTSGLETIIDDKEGWKLLQARLKRVAHVATVSPAQAYIDSIGLYTNQARAQLMQRIKEINPSVEPLDLRPALVKLRSIKQPVEIAAIQAAIDTTVDAFVAIQKQLPKAVTERDLEAIATSRFIKAGVHHAYEPIVAAGKNACTVHYIANSSAVSPDEFVLMDIGAEVSNYAADITRTYHPGEPTKRQQAVLEAVVDVQEFAKSLLKPGVILRDYEQRIEQYMGEKLRALGLISTIDTENVRTYYPYLTSHFLGLDVHDVGEYDKPLESGMVLTVEPGIHIFEEGIAVRIEDDVLITETGIDVLSKKLPPM